jgi:hypothetical protein
MCTLVPAHDALPLGSFPARTKLSHERFSAALSLTNVSRVLVGGGEWAVVYLAPLRAWGDDDDATRRPHLLDSLAVNCQLDLELELHQLLCRA